MKFYWDKARRKWVERPHSPPRPRIHLITDSCDPFKSMADGGLYDSKSAYRADLKARGFVEMGNDMPEHNTPEPQGIAEDIASVMRGDVPIERGIEPPEGFES